MKLFRKIRKIAKKTKVKMSRIKDAILCSLGIYVLVPIQVYASNDIVSRVNSIETLVVSIIAAAGAITTAFAAWDFFQAYQNQDTAQQSLSLRKIIGGIGMMLIASVLVLLK